MAGSALDNFHTVDGEGLLERRIDSSGGLSSLLRFIELLAIFGLAHGHSVFLLLSASFGEVSLENSYRAFRLPFRKRRRASA